MPRTRRPSRQPALRLGVQPCPGLRDGIFTDARGQRHDLARERRMRPKEAAADPRLQGYSVAAIRALVRTGQLYPVFRRNARVVEVFACGIGDWWDRQNRTGRAA